MARPASAWASSARRSPTRWKFPTAFAQASADLQKILPEGVDIRVTSDDATFIRGSIDEVRRTLMIAVGIVVAIIFLFLLDWRATLIPTVTLPIALIGTFAAIYLAGFSVNILTLLALVLATGMVVDDAIVVLENIVRKRNEGMGPRAAAVSAPARSSSRSSPRRRRLPPSSSRSPSCRGRPAGCSANSVSCSPSP
jgi:multidrug efflux pump subunit AcrB